MELGHIGTRASRTAKSQINTNADTQTLENPHNWNWDRDSFTDRKEKFAKADELLNRGQTLPGLNKPRETFESKAAFFKYLSKNSVDLFIYLRTNPAFINEQDESGRTLLHHTAQTGRDLHYSSGIIFAKELIFGAPGIDFTVKDNDGCTPLHLVAFGCGDKDTCRDLFPAFIEAALAHGFDFTIQGPCGYTILHLAVLVSYAWDDVHSGKNKNLDTALRLLDSVIVGPNGKAVLDALSDEGTTALFYCINGGLWEQASQLLDIGANPAVYGDEKHSPLSKLNEQKQEILDAIKTKYASFNASVEYVTHRLSRQIDEPSEKIQDVSAAIKAMHVDDDMSADQITEHLKQINEVTEQKPDVLTAIKEVYGSVGKLAEQLNESLLQIDKLISRCENKL